MNTNETPANPPTNDLVYTGQPWITEAIAQQEEHLRRNRSCRDVLGTAHAFRTFGVPAPDGRAASAVTYQACIVCGVTETDADYQRRNAARSDRI